MGGTRRDFELVRNIEHYLALLSKLYKREGELQKLSVVVNAQVRVQEEWTHDNWNGGVFGHALYLILPEDLYLSLLKDKQALQVSIRSDVNDVHNLQDEQIAEVFLAAEKVEDRDWRLDSGALRSPLRTVTPEASTRVWGESGYRVFLSHKSEVKEQVAALKKSLEAFGIAAFVAHKDISPTKAWQEEIENALVTMNSFVALLTSDFHDSKWTDQEVGFAVGRAVPMISVNLGLDPYGFIGKFQALSCSWDDAAIEIAKLLVAYPGMIDAYIDALPGCRSFEEGITLSKVLPSIRNLTDSQVARILKAYNEDSQLNGCWGFNGARPHVHGDGLATHLQRITGDRFREAKSGELKRIRRA